VGVGVGVDYGLYVFTRFKTLRAGPVAEAYRTHSVTGNGVLDHLLPRVATWIFSPLKFQADMGILLVFLFVMNMVGAIILLPLSRWLIERKQAAAHRLAQDWPAQR
jgi:predicted RND superfamily exporter protein